ncbi:MAG: hypothetical protein KGI51_11770 [Rhodospirillales bacterium]|nr:hypothetical protein [Rhodospirillales bacterium]
MHRTYRFPYDPALEHRVRRLEGDMREMQAGLSRVETAVTEIRTMLGATLPHLATDGDLANLGGELRVALGDKPGKLYLWGVLGVLVAAYAAGLAALAVLK